MNVTAAGGASKAKLIVTLCFLVGIVEGFDLQVMSGIGPLLRRTLNLNPQDLGFIFSATLIGLGIGATTGGYAADRLGRKRLIVLSAFAMSVFTFVTAAAVDFWSLFIGRVCTGLAIGGAMPNTIVMVEATSGRGRSAGVVTLMLCGVPAGGILSALAGHGLAEDVGWRGVLVAGGIFSLLVSVAAWLWLPEQAAPVRKNARMPLRTVLFGEGRALSTGLLWVLSILSLAMVALLATWLPTLVVDKGLPASAAYTTLLAWNIGGVAGVVTMGRLCDRLGSRNALTLAYLAMAVLFVLFAKGSTATTLMAFAMVVNFFVAGSHYTIYGLSPRFYPAEGASTGVGAVLATGRIGSVSGPAVAGIFLNAGSTGGQVIMGLVPLALVCAVCVIMLVAVSGGALARSREAGGKVGLAGR